MPACLPATGVLERCWLIASNHIVVANVPTPVLLDIDEPDLPRTLIMVLPVEWSTGESREWMIAYLMFQLRIKHNGTIGVIIRVNQLRDLRRGNFRHLQAGD